MTDRIHHLNRSERRLGRIIQALLVLGILLVLVDDVLDPGQVEPAASVETAAPSTPSTQAEAVGQADQTDRDSSPAASEPALPAIGATSTTVPVRTFTLVATGDIISHGAVAERADANVDEGWDYSEMFRRIRQIMAGAQLALCHLESPL